jgi:opacity protein-like surface antigen
MFSRMALARRPRSFVVSLTLIVLSASAAHAQCTAAGPLGSSLLAPTVAMAVAGVSSSVGALVTSINSANTAFLTQSSAFIGSPASPQPDQEGGGVWARGVGGHVSTSTPSTTGNINFGGPVAGSEISCNTRTHEDFAGVQIGTDFARLSVDGWNLHAGSTIGYLGANTQDATLPGLNPGPPTFHDSLQIPFVGLYGAASYGGLLFDGQIRGTFFQNAVSDENHGLAGQQFNASSISLTGNVAYNQNLGSQWFIEPSAGIIWSRTAVDPLNVPGTMVLASGAGPSGIPIPPWLLTVNDIESTLGRLSVRVGTTVTSGTVLLQPFASASVFHEFQGGVTSSLATNFQAIGVPPPNLNSTVLTSSLGTYGQFGLGVAAQLPNTGWLGYVRADYRTGEYIDGWSANGGVRYQFDPEPTPGGRNLLTKAPAGAAGAYNWTGLYIGGYAGADWGSTNWNTPGAGQVDPNFAGVLAGGEIGYNYQIGKWVFGVEDGAGWTNAHGARPCPIAPAVPSAASFFYNCEINMDWLSTATARIGYASWDRLLTYVKGGAAIAQDQARFVCDTNSQSTIPAVALAGCPSESDTKVKVGSAFGVGTEFGLTSNVSAKGEILYYDLGTDHRNLGIIETDTQRSGFQSTIGLNYHFGG